MTNVCMSCASWLLQRQFCSRSSKAEVWFWRQIRFEFRVSTPSCSLTGKLFRLWLGRCDAARCFGKFWSVDLKWCQKSVRTYSPPYIFTIKPAKSTRRPCAQQYEELFLKNIYWIIFCKSRVLFIELVKNANQECYNRYKNIFLFTRYNNDASWVSD